jgi:endonuclease/exonuclease/phosphatase (EEP) superfamily protein YafD
MKIVFLNAWYGQIREPLTEFIQQHRRDTDVFCFQEAHEPMLSLARGLLPDYQEIFFHKPVSDTDDFFQATYVRKGIGITSSGKILENTKNVGLGLWVRIHVAGKDVYVCNFHGLSRPVDKLESPARRLQSQAIVDFFSYKQGLKIIGGDFNALPTTECIRTFEANGYRDMIKDYGITNTRNRLVWERYPDTKQYFSDYVFVGHEVRVKQFEVIENEVSDHLPMILEIA